MTLTFTPINADKKPLGAVAYTALLYPVGKVTHRLALHKDALLGLPDAMTPWVVSDPVSGSRVCLVHGRHKGFTVTSNGYGPRDARDAAIATLDALVAKVGHEKFNQVVNAAKATA